MHPFLQLMLNTMTNSAANDLLLKKNCDMAVGPRMNEQLRAIYITRKYQRKEWADTEPVPDPFEAILKKDHLKLFHALNFGRCDEQLDSLLPLHAAASFGDPLLMAITASCSDVLDVQDINGWTPLCYAAFYENVEIVKFLLDFGSQPDSSGIDLFTLVVKINNDELNKILLPKLQYKGNNKVFIPRSVKFAPEDKKNRLQIDIDSETQALAKSLSDSYYNNI